MVKEIGIIVCGIILIVIPILTIIEDIKRNKRLKKEYDELNIGDKYRITYYQDSPFCDDIVIDCIIIDKKDGWVEYKDIEYGEKNSEKFIDFINYGWEKIENQRVTQL